MATQKHALYYYCILNEPHGIPVLRAPAFDKAHTDGAHSGELIDGLKALIDRLSQKRSKLLVVEDLQVTAYEE